MQKDGQKNGYRAISFYSYAVLTLCKVEGLSGHEKIGIKYSREQYRPLLYPEKDRNQSITLTDVIFG